jgi:Cu(I)/Ag(I) efflux system membrane fusion protein
MHQALAADMTPTPEVAEAFAKVAAELSMDETLPQPARDLLREVARQAEHLHHMDLAAMRTAFKPISNAVIALAAQVRGQDAQQAFTQFHCPMVPDGGGDWIQAGNELLNPYFGRQMLRCGDKVGVLPPRSTAETPPDADEEESAAGNGNREA